MSKIPSPAVDVLSVELNSDLRFDPVVNLPPTPANNMLLTLVLPRVWADMVKPELLLAPVPVDPEAFRL